MIYELTSQAEWEKALDSFSPFSGMAYYSFLYLKTLESNKEGIATALLYRDSGGLIFYPFLLRRIPQTLIDELCFDIESPYGYGGPVFEGTPCFKSFIREYSDWVLSHNVVAEFVRFNPMLQNHLLVDKFYDLSLNRRTVLVDTSSRQAILKNLSDPKRRNYKAALRNGLTCELGFSVDAFRDLYTNCMKKLDAEKYYFFDNAYYEGLNLIAQNGQLFFMKVLNAQSELVAGGLFLIDKASIHYHLGASNEAGKKLRANEFCMIEAAFWGELHNIQSLHIGGGIALEESDSLFRFKKGFSNRTLDFFIGKKIHQIELYKNISNKWRTISQKSSAKLLHYHDHEET